MLSCCMVPCLLNLVGSKNTEYSHNLRPHSARYAK